MGRPRKDPALKAVGSNPSGTTRKVDAPDIEPDAPDAPSTLTAEARAHWNNIVPRLERKGSLDQTFIGELVILCEAWSRYIRAMKKCKGKEIITGPNGGPVYSPWYGVMNSAQDTYIKLSERFGLDPRSIRGVHSKQKTVTKRKTL